MGGEGLGKIRWVGLFSGKSGGGVPVIGWLHSMCDKPI